ncbi:MAG: hypothetical protein LBM77_08640 [Spirochaetaceae bacterium]|jgi:hypothetical protein|nr:hypothetical protein [Spirochaetaceae bacterium]
MKKLLLGLFPAIFLLFPLRLMAIELDINGGGLIKDSKFNWTGNAAVNFDLGKSFLIGLEAGKDEIIQDTLGLVFGFNNAENNLGFSAGAFASPVRLFSKPNPGFQVSAHIDGSFSIVVDASVTLLPLGIADYTQNLYKVDASWLLLKNFVIDANLDYKSYTEASVSNERLKGEAGFGYQNDTLKALGFAGYNRFSVNNTNFDSINVGAKADWEFLPGFTASLTAGLPVATWENGKITTQNNKKNFYCDLSFGFKMDTRNFQKKEIPESTETTPSTDDTASSEASEAGAEAEAEAPVPEPTEPQTTTSRVDVGALNNADSLTIEVKITTSATNPNKDNTTVDVTSATAATTEVNTSGGDTTNTEDTGAPTADTATYDNNTTTGNSNTANTNNPSNDNNHNSSNTAQRDNNSNAANNGQNANTGNSNSDNTDEDYNFLDYVTKLE